MSQYNPKIHKRKSLRKKGYDYSRKGIYFITICVQHRACIFGNIKNGEMTLSDSGRMIHSEWLALIPRFPNIILHEFVVMPDHFHGILEITGPVRHILQPPIGSPHNAPDPDHVGTPLVGLPTRMESPYNNEKSNNRENNNGENEIDKNVFDRNVLNVNVFDENVFDKNVFDVNISDKNVFDENVFDENVSDVNVFDENLFDENVSDENVFDENLSDKNISDENVSDENVSDENLSDKNIFDENEIDENEIDENLSDENISDENVFDENISDENIFDENVSDENIFDENLSDENEIDENEIDENLSDENVSDENIFDENEIDENLSDENLSDENVSDENIFDENVFDENFMNLRKLKGQPQGFAPCGARARTHTGTENDVGGLNAFDKTVGDIMDAFKSITTVKYIYGVKQFNWQRFNGKLWQRNYWDVIINSDFHFRNVNRYIINNPTKWPKGKK